MPSTSLPTVQQCSETRDYLNQKTVVKVSFIGEDSAIATLASAQKKGTAFSGLGSAVAHSVIDSSVTEKLQSDRTKWNCTYTIYSPNGGSGGGDAFYTTLDSMTMVQQQFPLYKYLNAEESAAVVAWDEEDWNGDRATKEKIKKSDYKYWDTELSRFRLLSEVSNKAEAVAKKLLAGFEYVQKAYPQITHVEKFDTKKALTARKNALNHIDTNVPDLISGYSWLKVQFDWQQNDDGTWTLTESWMGVPSNQPWDSDLYGANAWDFFIPTAPAQNNNNNNN